MNAFQQHIVGAALGVAFFFAASAVAQEEHQDFRFEDDAAAPMARPATVPDGAVLVQLKDGSLLRGKVNLSGTYALSMRVGEAKISARQVISLEFKDDESVRIRAVGGDVYSGKLAISAITMEVAWGKVEVPIEHLKLVVNHAHVVDLMDELEELDLIPTVKVTSDGRVTTRFGPDYDYASEAFNDIADDIEDARTGTVN